MKLGTYTANLSRGERLWLVEVPEINRTTQARARGDVEAMARDLIAVMHDVPADSVGPAIRYDWPAEPLQR